MRSIEQVTRHVVALVERGVRAVGDIVRIAWDSQSDLEGTYPERYARTNGALRTTALTGAVIHR